MLGLNEQSDKLSVRAGKHCEWTLAKVCDVTSNAVIAEHIPLYRGREGGWREGEIERERGVERERGREGDGERESGGGDGG